MTQSPNERVSTDTRDRLGDVTICRNCGVETGASPPLVCPICTDERQWMPKTGQDWVKRSELETEGHRIVVDEREPGLFGLHVEPHVGIGQTCYLAQTEAGNLLFDVPQYIDTEAVAAIRALGGIAAITPSHPHMFGMQLEWSAAFDNAPVFVCAADADWVQRAGPAIKFYDEEVVPLPGTVLRRVGGHFRGSAVATWPGQDGRGVMFSGDSIGPVAVGMGDVHAQLPQLSAVVRSRRQKDRRLSGRPRLRSNVRQFRQDDRFGSRRGGAEFR